MNISVKVILLYMQRKNMINSKLSIPAIEANINYYESLVKNAHDTWEQHLQQLQYWIDELEKTRENANTTHSS